MNTKPFLALEDVRRVAQAAEAELQRLMELYTTKAAIFPATEPIQPEQEIIF